MRKRGLATSGMRSSGSPSRRTVIRCGDRPLTRSYHWFSYFRHVKHQRHGPTNTFAKRNRTSEVKIRNRVSDRARQIVRQKLNAGAVKTLERNNRVALCEDCL